MIVDRDLDSYHNLFDAGEQPISRSGDCDLKSHKITDYGAADEITRLFDQRIAA